MRSYEDIKQWLTTNMVTMSDMLKITGYLQDCEVHIPQIKTFSTKNKSTYKQFKKWVHTSPINKESNISHTEQPCFAQPTLSNDPKSEFMKSKEEIIHYMKDKMFAGNENLNEALVFLYAKGVLVDDITVFTHAAENAISANDFITWFNEVPKVDKVEELIDDSKPIQFRLLANSISDLYEEKNKAYGDSFGKSVNKYGLVSALTRMSDKWNRLENLILNNERENDESLEDTLKDLASYCLMTIMELKNGNE